jgi:Fur family ferric uptake transcriptional regulator
MSSGAVEAASRLLRERGQRVTRPRLAVIEALAALEGHPSADTVAEVVSSGPDPVHRATVYRTLDTLAELGVVTHVHSSHGTTAYHLADGTTPHLHARCRGCGTVVDLPPDLLEQVTRRVEESAGFALEPDHVALTGLCAACR